MDKIVEKMNEKYGKDLIYIFDKKNVKDNILIALVKDEANIDASDEISVMKYNDNFEAKLNFKLPTKNRRTKQIISYQESLSLINKIAYGVLSFDFDGIPYGVALNHICYQGRIFFHSALAGFKLNAIGKNISYLIIEDLGISEPASTHNHRSVMIQGTLEKVTNNELKKEVLISLMKDLTPNNVKPVADAMINAVNILELNINYIHGKEHIR